MIFWIHLWSAWFNSLDRNCIGDQPLRFFCLLQYAKKAAPLFFGGLPLAASLFANDSQSERMA